MIVWCDGKFFDLMIIMMIFDGCMVLGVGILLFYDFLVDVKFVIKDVGGFSVGGVCLFIVFESVFEMLLVIGLISCFYIGCVFLIYFVWFYVSARVLVVGVCVCCLMG